MKMIFSIFTILVFPLVILGAPPSVSAAPEENPLFLTSNSSRTVIVERVLSADTLLLKTGEKIKLIGLRAPDLPIRERVIRDRYGFVVEDENPVTPLDAQAFNFAKALLKGKTVRLEFDAQRKDENFATFAYVFVLPENIFANAEILKNGFAYLQLRPPNMKYEDLLRAAYKEARQEKRGLANE